MAHEFDMKQEMAKAFPVLSKNETDWAIYLSYSLDSSEANADKSVTIAELAKKYSVDVAKVESVLAAAEAENKQLHDHVVKYRKA